MTGGKPDNNGGPDGVLKLRKEETKPKIVDAFIKPDIEKPEFEIVVLGYGAQREAEFV